MLIVIDCKDYAKPVDVKGVEEFMGLVHVGAHRAAMVAAQGYTETAKKRAAHDAGIELLRVIDTGDHPWKVTSYIPAVCVVTAIKAISSGFTSTGFAELRFDTDYREMMLFDLAGDRNWKGEGSYPREKWNAQQLPGRVRKTRRS
ncbi:MAG: restriction endonuclease [Bryobacterales bacterium]|nr:restriction endonuclease [Bryobacterales bacterium]